MRSKVGQLGSVNIYGITPLVQEIIQVQPGLEFEKLLEPCHFYFRRSFPSIVQMCLISALKDTSKQRYMLCLFPQMHLDHKRTGSHEVSLELKLTETGLMSLLQRIQTHRLNFPRVQK